MMYDDVCAVALHDGKNFLVFFCMKEDVWGVSRDHLQRVKSYSIPGKFSEDSRKIHLSAPSRYHFQIIKFENFVVKILSDMSPNFYSPIYNGLLVL